jgi:hypothetical protein
MLDGPRRLSIPWRNEAFQEGSEEVEEWNLLTGIAGLYLSDLKELTHLVGHSRVKDSV